MHLKKSLLIAIALGIAAITAWELYWRSKGYQPGLEETKDLWAVQREKVENSGKKDVLLLGDSRLLFDIQLNDWERETGTRPIQLATPGTTPLPAFHDIVKNTDYSGNIVISVTPIVFFSTTNPHAEFWHRIQSRVDYYKKRTLANQLNHFLDIPLQQNLAFLANDEELWADDLDLKTLLRNIQVGDRLEGMKMPPFYRFQEIEIDRNLKMTERTATDTSFANTVKNVWGFYGQQAASGPPPDKESVLSFFLSDLSEFKSRGGNVILVRCPSSGLLREVESKMMPRTEFYDILVEAADVPAYHFEDYEQLNQFYCPEWSHLSAQDASTFSTELARILIKDQVINN